jgi:hypothetical protein
VAGSREEVICVMEEQNNVPADENEQKRKTEAIKEWMEHRNKQIKKERQKENRRKERTKRNRERNKERENEEKEGIKRLGGKKRLERCTTLWSMLKFQQCSLRHINGDDVSSTTKGITKGTMVSKGIVAVM